MSRIEVALDYEELADNEDEDCSTQDRIDEAGSTLSVFFWSMPRLMSMPKMSSAFLLGINVLDNAGMSPMAKYLLGLVLCVGDDAIEEYLFAFLLLCTWTCKSLPLAFGMYIPSMPIRFLLIGESLCTIRLFCPRTDILRPRRTVEFSIT